MAPRNIIVLPVLFENQLKAVIELRRSDPSATFRSCFWSNSPTASASCSIVLQQPCKPRSSIANLRNRVADRTAELEFLAREVDHRAKNILAVVQSICRLSKAENPKPICRPLKVELGRSPLRTRCSLNPGGREPICASLSAKYLLHIALAQLVRKGRTSSRAPNCADHWANAARASYERCQVWRTSRTVRNGNATLGSSRQCSRHDLGGSRRSEHTKANHQRLWHAKS